MVQYDTIKSTLRKGIIEKSIQILRTHGNSETEIKSMLSKDFSISEEELSELLKTESKT